jgi:hypothetical protein
MPIEITNVGIKGPKGDTGPSGAPLTAVSGVPIKLINPLSTFTGLVASDNGAGKTLITGVGSHGLLAADAVGANIYLISGTGWTPGLKKILSIDADNGNAITVDVPFASQGSPSVALGSTAVGVASIAIPALGASGFVRVDASVTVKNTANSKKFQYRLANNIFAESEDLANTKSHRMIAVLNNRGDQANQVGMASGVKGGVGSSGNELNLIAVNTTSANTMGLVLVPYPAEPITLERYAVESYA